MRRCAGPMSQLNRHNVKVTVLYLTLNSVSATYQDFTLFFSQIFTSKRPCAELNTQLRRLEAKVTVQDHGIYL